MAVLGCTALGLATALLVLVLRRGHAGSRGAITGSVATGVGGAVLAGLVAVSAGVAPMADFFDIGVWLLALGGAVVALVVYELLRDPGGEPGGSRSRLWAGSAGGESERLDHNW